MDRYFWHKEMRLRRPQDFRRIWKSGRSWAHPLFILWALPNALSHTRVGLTASRKVGNAVDRNRARRLLREAARHLYANISPGWDIVLVARRSIVNVKAQRVQQVLELLLRQADIWCEDGH